MMRDEIVNLHEPTRSQCRRCLVQRPTEDAGEISREQATGRGRRLQAEKPHFMA